jgi:predicted RNA binding protein YcfA (HicA-like mRNA interferase family)
LSKLPVVSGKEICKASEKIGYRVDHLTGSHIILRNDNPPYRRLTVPNHKEIAKGSCGPLSVRRG